MENIDSNYIIIAGASVIILSYFFNILAKKTSIPSVLMLIVIGTLIHPVMDFFHLDLLKDNNFKTLLNVLGTVGLILIVLEASLDLKLERKKLGLILKSLLIAFLGLLLSTVVISIVFFFVFDPNWIISTVYAIPLAIISSAIVMPSIGNLIEEQKEFLIYESAFSDILGIMLFYFFIGNLEEENTFNIVLNIGTNISLTLLLSIIVGYGLIIILQKLTTHVKFFLLIAVLFIIYSTGKLMHLSPLLAIMFFGLMINNRALFFKGFLSKFINEDVFSDMLGELKTMTLETAFLVRTFFFFIFGISIQLDSLINLNVLLVSILVVIGIYIVRIGLFQSLIKGVRSPQQFVSPRGLITILLFFQIPEKYSSQLFESGVLLYVILITSIIMTISLIRSKKKMQLEKGKGDLEENHTELELIEKSSFDEELPE